jgi:hypothetical protein
MPEIKTETSADEMRTASARAREHLLPAVTARVVERDTSVVVICGHHDEPAEICRNCHYFDVQDRVLARLVATLINAREPLASWLEKTSHIVDSFRLPSHPEHEPCDDPCCYTAHHALAVARVLNGGPS